MGRSAMVAVALSGAVAVTGAQDGVFRARVDLVTVDATVLGRDGRPMPGLGPEDFVLRVDGRERPVVSAQFVAQPPPTSRPVPVRPSHFTSNEHIEAGRWVVIAVDEAHIRRLEGRSALSAAARFLDALDPLDHVAVTGLSKIGDIEFTRDRAVLKRRLGSLVGHTDPVFLQFNIGLLEAVDLADGSRTRLADVVLRECGRSLTEYTSTARAADEAPGRDACPEQVEQEARAVAQHARTQARISLSGLGALVDTLKSIEGPKTVVLLSEGMVVDARLVDLSQLVASTREARVTIYALHLEAPLFEAAQTRISPTLLQDVQIRGDGLARLAGSTRGNVFRLVGSDPRPFERIAEEIAGYYLLAFAAVDADRDGRAHRITVSLARGGGALRTREEFRLPAVMPSPRAREEELVALLRESRIIAELPVRAATYSYVEPGSDDFRVIVSTEAEAAGGPASDVLIGYVLTDASGVIATSGAELADTGRHAFSARLVPGSYTLRVAGIDPLGRKGLVQRPFQTAIHSEAGLRVSDLIVAPVPARRDARLQPFVDRVTAALVTANVELYGSASGALENIDVQFEICEEGKHAPHRTVAGSLIRRESHWVIARAVLPLADLRVGRYIAAARIRIAGTELEPVVRPFTYRP